MLVGERTVSSMRAQPGTRVPEGTALGNLRVKSPLVHAPDPIESSTHVEGAKVDEQLVIYSVQLNCE